MLRKVTVNNIKSGGKTILFNEFKNDWRVVTYRFKDFGSIYDLIHFNYINDLLKLRHEVFSSDAEKQTNSIKILKLYFNESLQDDLRLMGEDYINIILFNSPRVEGWSQKDMFAFDYPVDIESGKKDCDKDENIIYNNNSLVIYKY